MEFCNFNLEFLISHYIDNKIVHWFKYCKLQTLADFGYTTQNKKVQQCIFLSISFASIELLMSSPLILYGFV